MLKKLYVWLFHTKVIRGATLSVVTDMATILVKKKKWCCSTPVKVNFFCTGFYVTLVRKGHD